MNLTTLFSTGFFSKFFLSLFGALTVALFAQLSIELDWTEAGVSITGQTFAVLIIGFLLPRPWGIVALLFYLLLGVLGFPVFAEGASGAGVFLKGSGGYLYGFVAGAGLMGWLADKGWGDQFGKIMLAMLLGTLVIVVFGLAWLSYLYGFSKALEYGLYPFIPGAIIKILAGAIVVWIWQRVKKSSLFA